MQATEFGYPKTCEQCAALGDPGRALKVKPYGAMINGKEVDIAERLC